MKPVHAVAETGRSRTGPAFKDQVQSVTLASSGSAPAASVHAVADTGPAFKDQAQSVTPARQSKAKKKK